MGFLVRVRSDEGVLPALPKTPEEFVKGIRFLAAVKMVRHGAGVAGEGR